MDKNKYVMTAKSIESVMNLVGNDKEVMVDGDIPYSLKTLERYGYYIDGYMDTYYGDKYGCIVSVTVPKSYNMLNLTSAANYVIIDSDVITTVGESVIRKLIRYGLEAFLGATYDIDYEAVDDSISVEVHKINMVWNDEYIMYKTIYQGTPKTEISIHTGVNHLILSDKSNISKLVIKNINETFHKLMHTGKYMKCIYSFDQIYKDLRSQIDFHIADTEYDENGCHNHKYSDPYFVFVLDVDSYNLRNDDVCIDDLDVSYEYYKDRYPNICIITLGNSALSDRAINISDIDPYDMKFVFDFKD